MCFNDCFHGWVWFAGYPRRNFCPCGYNRTGSDDCA
jgi:hypothetical protein